jgi:hypothetical protein
MKKQRLPHGWNEKQIRELAARHDNQSDEQQANEIDSALSEKGQTLMVAPTRLVPKIH